MTDTVYDAIVVLGYDINPDGQMPEESKNRAKKAAELYLSGRTKHIIFTGKDSYSRTFKLIKTEARSMADLAEELGVPKSAIILEEKARDTEENAKFSKIIVDDHKWKSLLFVTGEFQLERQKYICTHIFGDAYNIDFVISENGLNDEELEHERQLELQKWKKIKLRS